MTGNALLTQRQVSEKVVPILDFYHATEHLWELGRSLWGERSPQVKPWVEAAKAWLAEGAVEELPTQWRDLSSQDPEGFARELTYFGNQRGRMKYDEYRAGGYPIGGSAVESANRHLVGIRVKQAGMRWLEPAIKRGIGLTCPVAQPTLESMLGPHNSYL